MSDRKLKRITHTSQHFANATAMHFILISYSMESQVLNSHIKHLISVLPDAIQQYVFVLYRFCWTYFSMSDKNFTARTVCIVLALTRAYQLSGSDERGIVDAI